jgi:nanoRNase/pAp phosphatase (c-di-AMP/oligoRNAs hydrolase)
MSVCLPSYNIDHTDIPNDSTIIFTMRDRSVWKNTLTYPCIGLRLDTRGFTYEATDPGSDTICSNLVTIHTNTDHNVCELGAFTKVTGPARS